MTTPDPESKKTHLVGFLYEPEWMGSGWVEILLAYLEAFQPGEPVGLVLLVDSRRTGQLSMEEAQTRVIEVVLQTGRALFPDVILADLRSELKETLRTFERVQWVPMGNPRRSRLQGPYGARFARVLAETPHESWITPEKETELPRLPAVTVVVPTWNRPDLLRRALRSIQEQTYRDFEVIVVNDAGSEIGPICEGFRKEGMNLQVLEQPYQRGQSAARNAAIARARGRWIAYLDDDDLYCKDHLEVLVTTLTATRSEVAFTDAIRVVEAETGATRAREAALSFDFDPERILKEPVSSLIAVMHARTCWEEVGPMDEELPVLEDWEFLIRLSKRWEFVHVPKATVELRWQENGASASARRGRLVPLYRELVRGRVAPDPTREGAELGDASPPSAGAGPGRNAASS